jgi:hypothetical protein
VEYIEKEEEYKKIKKNYRLHGKTDIGSSYMKLYPKVPGLSHNEI